MVGSSSSQTKRRVYGRVETVGGEGMARIDGRRHRTDHDHRSVIRFVIPISATGAFFVVAVAIVGLIPFRIRSICS